MYQNVAELKKSPMWQGLLDSLRQRTVKWRRGLSIVRLDKPTRLARARALGYRAKQGYFVVRVRIRRGGLRKPRPRAGRRQKKMGVTKFTTGKSLRQIAEERVARKYPNLKILNSYWIWEDGKYKWYEVILVDPNHPEIKQDHRINWICGRRLLQAEN